MRNKFGNPLGHTLETCGGVVISQFIVVERNPWRNVSPATLPSICSWFGTNALRAKGSALLSEPSALT